ncbi:hypothetical protein Tco_0916755 [Tanacetum coccineum]
MQARNSFQLYEGVATWFVVIKEWEITAWNPEFIEDASELGIDVEYEGSEPHCLIRIYALNVAEKDIKQVVSDDPSHPPGFTKNVELEQKVGEVDSSVDKDKAQKDADKMSKLDRFLVSEGLMTRLSALSGIILDRHLSDHRPILLWELVMDYGPTPFRLFHSWFMLNGFDRVVVDSWNLDVKLKIEMEIQNIDRQIDIGECGEHLLSTRRLLCKEVLDIDNMKVKELVQKAKVKWDIEGGKNTKFFHGIINKRRHQMAIRGVSVNGEWVVDSTRVKNEFYHRFATRFATRFSAPVNSRISYMCDFPLVFYHHQVMDLESNVTEDEFQKAVWDCGVDKSLGPDGFMFEFIRKFWDVLGVDEL